MTLYTKLVYLHSVIATAFVILIEHKFIIHFNIRCIAQSIKNVISDKIISCIHLNPNLTCGLKAELFFKTGVLNMPIQKRSQRMVMWCNQSWRGRLPDTWLIKIGKYKISLYSVYMVHLNFSIIESTGSYCTCLYIPHLQQYSQLPIASQKWT